MTVTKFESNLLDAVTAIVMTPVAAVYWLLWLLWQGVVAIAPYRKYWYNVSWNSKAVGT